jgi:hypothetical protein
MKRRSFVGALAALVVAPKALLGKRVESLTRFPEPIIGAALTPDISGSYNVEPFVVSRDDILEAIMRGRWAGVDEETGALVQ